MKKLALYHPWIYLHGGAERVLLEIVNRSSHQITLFTNHINYEQTFEQFSRMDNIRELKRVSIDRNMSNVINAARVIATQKIDLKEFDALVISSEGLGDFINFRNSDIPVVCFCHTPVRPIYDPVYRASWLQSNPGKRIPFRLMSYCYRYVNKLAWQRYRHVIANSNEVKSRIARGNLCPEHDIEVIHPGADVENIHPTGVFKRYFLYAGRIKWTKNVDLALDAFKLFQQHQSVQKDWKLIVAGQVDQASKEYLEHLREKGERMKGVEFIVSPSTEELNRLYSECSAVVFTALNEDWGIVPVEAMAWGKPVIAVNSGGPVESVVDGETGYLVSPEANAFADCMLLLANDKDELQRLSVNARAHSSRYSWSEFVTRIDQAVEKVFET